MFQGHFCKNAINSNMVVQRLEIHIHLHLFCSCYVMNVQECSLVESLSIVLL